MRGRALNLIWDAMRKAEIFTTQEVAIVSACEQTTVRKYLKDLVATGFVELVGTRENGKLGGDRYKVVRSDVKVPKVGETESKEGAQDKMWRSMRIFRSFTVSDIAATSSLHIETVKRYVNKLKQAGYVSVQVSNGGGGKRGAYNLYRLLKDTGVRSPVVLRDGRVFDCNLNEYVEIAPQKENRGC
jgi:predicted transcriptional regulator